MDVPYFVMETLDDWDMQTHDLEGSMLNAMQNVTLTWWTEELDAETRRDLDHRENFIYLQGIAKTKYKGVKSESTKLEVLEAVSAWLDMEWNQCDFHVPNRYHLKQWHMGLYTVVLMDCQDHHKFYLWYKGNVVGGISTNLMLHRNGSMYNKGCTLGCCNCEGVDFDEN